MRPERVGWNVVKWVNERKIQQVKVVDVLFGPFCKDGSCGEISLSGVLRSLANLRFAKLVSPQLYISDLLASFA